MTAALARLRVDRPSSPDLPDALSRLANSLLREAAMERGARLTAEDVDNLIRLWSGDTPTHERRWAPIRRDYSFAAEARRLSGPAPPAPPASVFAHVLRHAPARPGGQPLARRVARWGVNLARAWRRQPAKVQVAVIRAASEELGALLDLYLEVVAASAGGPRGTSVR